MCIKHGILRTFSSFVGKNPQANKFIWKFRNLRWQNTLTLTLRAQVHIKLFLSFSVSERHQNVIIVRLLSLICFQCYHRPIHTPSIQGLSSEDRVKDNCLQIQLTENKSISVGLNKPLLSLILFVEIKRCHPLLQYGGGESFVLILLFTEPFFLYFPSLSFFFLLVSNPIISAVHGGQSAGMVTGEYRLV